ncbi:MAG: kelch repeat-containing protein [Bacteroidota bacterium]
MRYKATAFVIDNIGYVGTGISPEKGERDFWRYIPGDDRWEQIDSLPAGARAGAFSFVINGKGYVGGGEVENNNPRNDLWEFDPQLNKWTKKADLPITVAGQGSMKGFSIGEKGYVLATFNDNNFFEYNPEKDSWKAMKNFNGNSKLDFVSFSSDTKGYIGCGFNGTENINEIWQFDPVKNDWMKKTDFPGFPRSKEVAFHSKDYAYVGMGIAEGKYHNDFWRYNMADDTWEQVDSCGYGAYGAFAMFISGRGYVGTGVFTEFPEFWEYTPVYLNNERVTEKNVNVYPNPAAEVIYIKNIHQNNYTINFYNVEGKRMKVVLNSPENISISNLPVGMYVLEIVMENQKVHKTFIKY